MKSHDARLSGFAELLPLSEARTLIDAMLPQVDTEIVKAGSAAFRVLAESIAARVPVPASDRAAIDGYAVRAADTEGAGDYTPISLIVRAVQQSDAVRSGCAVVLGLGQRLPAGADTMLPFVAAGHGNAANIDIATPLARGMGVARSGSELTIGTVAVPAGRRLRPQDIALLFVLGHSEVSVLRRPRVTVIVIGPRAPEGDAVTPMLASLLARDGAAAEFRAPAAQDIAAIAGAVTRGVESGDLVLVAGRSGAGADDDAASAIHDAGGVAVFHGVALRPGESAGCWRLGKTPVLLLPGAPLACLVAYDSLVSPMVRRLAGLPQAAYLATSAVLDRKIVSTIGCDESVRVLLSNDRAVPLGTADVGGLASAARADGFVLVPASSEGYPPGASVRVHLYDGAPQQ